MVNITATSTIEFGSSEAHSWKGLFQNNAALGAAIDGGTYTYIAEGTFGGGTVKLQYSRSGKYYHDLDDELSLTASGSKNIEIAAGHIKPVISGSSSAEVNVYVSPIQQYEV